MGNRHYEKTYTDRLDRYPMGLLLSFGFRGRVTSSQDGNMPFSWSIVTSRPKPVTYSFSGSLDGVSAGVTNVTMLWLPTKSTIRSTPCSFCCFSNSRFLVAVSSSAKLMTAYLSPIIHRYMEIETEQGLTSPPAQYRLSWRQFYRSKDPANSIKVLKGKCYKNKETQKKQYSNTTDTNTTRSQAVTKIADRTASHHLWGQMTSSVTWPYDTPYAISYR